LHQTPAQAWFAHGNRATELLVASGYVSVQVLVNDEEGIWCACMDVQIESEVSFCVFAGLNILKERQESV